MSDRHDTMPGEPSIVICGETLYHLLARTLKLMMQDPGIIISAAAFPAISTSPSPVSLLGGRILLTVAVIIVLFVIVVVLLLNLLIAMFTYSFDRVQNNTDGDMDKWNTIRYDIITEYYHKSPFVPPFNVFEALFNLARRLCRWCKCCNSQSVGDDVLEWRNKKAMSLYRRPMRSTTEYLQHWNYCQAKGSLKQGKSITEGLINLEYATMANYTQSSRKVVVRSFKSVV